MPTLPNRLPVPEPDAQVGRRARAFREASGLSQYRLSLILGVRTTDVASFEVGRIRRGEGFVRRYAEAVGAPYEAIVPPPTRLDEIRARRRKGATLASIAAEFGVSRQAIHQAIRRAP